MRVALLKRVLVGRPMPLAQARHERLRKRVALAIFSSDAMSSVAYATEEILLILVLAGTAALHLSLPIAIAITALLAIVAISYQQTIDITSRQQAVYDRAVRLSYEHGPCCCRCWRWTAFGGQAKYLITRRRFTAKRIAEVWGLEDGCGGEGHAHASA